MYILNYIIKYYTKILDLQLLYVKKLNLIFYYKKMIFKENFRLNFQIMKKNNLKKSLESNYLTNKKEINFKEKFQICFFINNRNKF